MLEEEGEQGSKSLSLSILLVTTTLCMQGLTERWREKERKQGNKGACQGHTARYSETDTQARLNRPPHAHGFHTNNNKVVHDTRVRGMCVREGARRRLVACISLSLFGWENCMHGRQREQTPPANTPIFRERRTVFLDGKGTKPTGSPYTGPWLTCTIIELNFFVWPQNKVVICCLLTQQGFSSADL